MPSSDSFGARSHPHGRRARPRDLPPRRAPGRYDVARLPVLAEGPAGEPAAQRGRRGGHAPPTSRRSPRWVRRRRSPASEIAFTPARVLMQDFTGVPARRRPGRHARRDGRPGRRPGRINPLVPVELVIDHSVQVDVFGDPRRLRSATPSSSSSATTSATPSCAGARAPSTTSRSCRPNTGICHQVNLEYLARVVFGRRGTARPSPTRWSGTDSHTTMVNGLGVLGWGVGGIEAEAAMLGQPVSMLIPQVVGFRLAGELPEGATATDLVLTVTQMLRERGVVGQVRGVLRPRAADLPLADRATIGNMSPEFGATCAIFPVDAETLRYLEFSGRPAEQVELVEAYAASRASSTTPDAEEADVLRHPRARPRRRSCRASPGRAGRRTAWRSPRRRRTFGPSCESCMGEAAEHEPRGHGSPTRASASVPGQRPAPRSSRGTPGQRGTRRHVGRRRTPPWPPTAGARWPTAPRSSSTTAHVVIAAITSCTNTSNPSVMLGAGLLARNAVERGLTRQAVGQDHRSPRARRWSPTTSSAPA